MPFLTGVIPISTGAKPLMAVSRQLESMASRKLSSSSAAKPVNTRITELVFPDIKNDVDSLSQFHSKIPGLMKREWANTSGMHSLRVAKVLDVAGQRPQKHSGLCLVLTWDELASFQSFVSSPKFINTMNQVKPLAAGPSDLKLFKTPTTTKTSPQDMLSQSSYLQVFQVRNQDATQRQEDESNSPAVETAEAWSRLTESIKEAAAEADSFQITGQEQPKFFCANGLGESADGVFLGLVGWESLNNMQAVTSDPEVQTAFNAFIKPRKAAVRDVSITTLELDGFSS